MSDNVTVTSGIGVTIAADEVTDGTLGTVKVQYVKLMDGSLDGTSKGVISSSGLGVSITNTVLPVSGIVNQGTNPWVIVGSVAMTNSISVSTGSNVWVKGGSIQPYNPIGIGSVLITNPGVIGSIEVQTILGSVAISSPISVSTGSEVYIKSGSVQTYNPIGIGSVLITNPTVVGSISTQTIIGSVAISSPISVATGSESYVKAGSVILLNSLLPVSGIVNQGTNPWIVLGSVAVSSPISVATGSEMYVKAGSVIITGSVLTYGASVSTGSEVWIKAGSVQTYNPIGIGSVLVTNGSLSVYGSFSASTGSEVWVKGGSIQTYNPIGVGSIGVASGSVAITNTNLPVWTGIGSVLITNPSVVGSLAVQAVQNKPIVHTGSIVTTGGLGSKTVTGLLNTINWISVKGLNAGSTYFFGIKDSEDYLIQSLLSRTGDFANLTPIPGSGTLVLTISGAQVNGTYNFRIAYI